MKPYEPAVSPGTPMPKGYGFLKKGSPYMTTLCRRKTHEAGKTLYIVMSKAKPEGVRAPKSILDEVFAEERATRSKRRDVVERRDASTQDAFEDSINRLFPKAPKHDVAAILKRALKKRSGRVGRTGKLELDEKARLAVQAHVRHCHTHYDKLLRKTKDRAAARRAIHGEMVQVLSEWGGAAAVKPAEKDSRERKRKAKDPFLPRKVKRRRLNPAKEKTVRPPEDDAAARPGTEAHEHEKPAQPPAAIDLTLDETEPEDADQLSSEIASGEEDQDSGAVDENEDGLYELSDMDMGGDSERNPMQSSAPETLGHTSTYHM